ncbi:MAG: hypothetical protein KC414_01110, partial [Romboutsia sp.]|nr:hypothetical protein [Romboutsia sp.]
MKFKKILPLAISLSLMAGCSGKKQSATPTNEEIVTEIKNPVEITFWHAMNGDQEKSLQGLVDNFQKENPHLSFDTKHFPLKAEKESILQGFFHTLINANPHAKAKHVIRWITKEALDELLKNYKQLSSGIPLKNLFQGFYTQESRDGELILCFNRREMSVSPKTPLTLEFNQFFAKPEKWQGNYLCFEKDSEEDKTELKTEDFKKMALF